ncbi:MAG: uridylate kinase [Methanoregula sp.]|nr:uridylate kinase [Methanoregula sp.]
MIADKQKIPGSNSAALVVKLGGSLYNHVPDIVPVLRSSPYPLLIIPGGGPFANAVRQAGLDDETAHWEAIAAMGQYGRYIASHDIPVTERLEVPHRTTLFLPGRCLREQDPLPHSWDVTSDTIAAWVAAVLRLDLLLLKSVDGIVTGGVLQEHVNTPQQTVIVDPLVIPYVLENRVDTFILNGSRQELLARYLRGDRVPGTRISTTF